MPFIIILSFFLLLQLLSMYAAYKSDDEFAFGFIFISVIIVFFVLSIMGYRAVTKDTRWEAFKYEYESTVEIVETYHPYDYGNTKDITEKVFEINSILAENKAKCKSPWFKIWYSEEIAKLEPIPFKNVQKNE